MPIIAAIVGVCECVRSASQQVAAGIIEIQQDKEDIEDYKAYKKAWKVFLKVQEVE